MTMKISKTFLWPFHYLNSMSFTNQVELVKLTSFYFSQIHLVDQKFPILTWLQLKKKKNHGAFKILNTLWCIYEDIKLQIMLYMSSGLTLSLQSSTIHFLPFWRGYLEAWFLIHWKKGALKTFILVICRDICQLYQVGN